MSDLRSAYLLVCLARASPPLLDFVILPWIAPFLIDLSIANSVHVGMYTGWLQSVFSFCVVLGVFPATWSSDRFGRKPTILFGLVAASVWSMCFPFRTSFPTLLLMRGLLGFCAAFVPPALKTHLVEISDEKTRPVFFAMSSFGFSLGLVTAPALGGIFVKPATTFTWFQGGLFDAYPYALPCVVATMVPLSTAFIGFFLMKETRPAAMSSHITKRASLQSLMSKPAIGPISFLNKRSVYILSIWFASVLLSNAYAQIEVVLYYTSRDLGGMGLTTRETSAFLVLRPLFGSVWLFVFYPRFARAFGPEKALLCSLLWPVLLALYFLLQVLAQAGASSAVLFTGLILAFCMSALITPMYLACEQIIAKRSTPENLAKTCAADEILANVGGGLGAAIGPSLLALTLDKGYLASKSVWLVLGIWATGVAFACTRVTADATPIDTLEGEQLLRENSLEEASELTRTTSRA